MDTVFFIFSKILQFFIEPLNWALLFVILSLVFLSLRKFQLCRRFLFLAIFDLLIVGWLPASEVFLRGLENIAPKTSLAGMPEKDVGGIIILGGAVKGGQIALDRGEVSICSSAERVTKAFELIRKFPDLPFIFSGHSNRLRPKGISEAEAFQQLIAEQGLAEISQKTAHYENQSRNTYENVLYMKAMIAEYGQKNDSGALKPWLLITSASHMFRSVNIFEKHGVNVIPVPVDYQTSNTLNWATFDLTEGAQNWNNFLHELVGLFAYWATGKI